MIETVAPVQAPVQHGEHPRLLWEGQDDHGVELEVVAIDVGSFLLVIHVMPSHYRRRRS